MAKQRLFDDEDNYNELGNKVGSDVHNVLMKLMRYYIKDRNISARDLAHVMTREIQAVESIIHMGEPGSSKE